LEIYTPGQQQINAIFKMSIWLNIIFFHIIMVYDFGKCNLAEWLTDFSDCHFQIKVLANNNFIDIGDIQFPIRLSVSNQSISFNYTGSHYLKLQLRLCTLEVRVFSKQVLAYTLLHDPTWISSNSRPDPIWDHTKFSITGLTNSYTNSYSFNILLLPEGWEILDVGILKFFAAQNVNNDQYFYFTYTDLEEANFMLNITGAFYMPMLTNPTTIDFEDFPLVARTCQNIRRNMINTINRIYQRGRNVVCSIVTTEFSPVMPNYGLEDNYFNIILTSHPEFEYLRDMTSRDYYFYHRRNLSFLRLNQAILFDHVEYNLSSLFHKGSWNFSGDVNKKWLFSKSSLIRIETILYSDDSYEIQKSLEVYPTGLNYFNFVTCHGFSQRPSVMYYFQPLDNYTWILTSVAIVGISLTLFFIGLKNWKCLAKISINLFYSISVILENGFGNLGRAITNCRIYKISFVLLALISFMVGNMYKSLITVDIITPIPGSIPVNYLSELKGWSIAVLPFQYLLDPVSSEDIDTLNLIREESRKFRGNGIQLSRTLRFRYSSLFGFLATKDFNGTVNPTSEINTLLSLQQDIRLFSSRVEVVNYLSSCMNKALVGSLQEVDRFRKFSMTQGLKLGIGKDVFMPTMISWGFSKVTGEFLNRKFSSLISSGIYHRWEHIFYSRTRSQLDMSETSTIHTNQSLDTQLGALFILYGICISFCIVFYVVEHFIAVLYHLLYCIVRNNCFH